MIPACTWKASPGRQKAKQFTHSFKSSFDHCTSGHKPVDNGEAHASDYITPQQMEDYRADRRQTAEGSNSDGDGTGDELEAREVGARPWEETAGIHVSSLFVHSYQFTRACSAWQRPLLHRDTRSTIDTAQNFPFTLWKCTQEKPPETLSADIFMAHSCWAL